MIPNALRSLALLVSIPAFIPAQSGPVPTQAADPLLLKATDLKQGTVQQLRLPQASPKDFQVRAVFAGETCTLLLQTHDVRAANFRVLVDDGQGIRAVPPAASTTYRGLVHGYPDSVVAASLIGGRLLATVQFAPGQKLFGIQPVPAGSPGYTAQAHLVYSSDANDLPPHRCGTVAPATAPPGQLGFGGSANVVCEIAIDADYDFYLKNGSSVSNTQNDITAVINGVDAIYRRDVQVEFKITQILVRTSRVYTSTDSGTLLTRFGARWNSLHGSITRDVAHLFTGKNLNGGTIGVAFLGTVCNTLGAYGLSESRFSNNFTSRVGLTCHELGHNFSAPHCDGRGTCNIMCSGLGGCSRSVRSFASYSIGFIAPFAQKASCLSPAQPPVVLSSVKPASVQAVAGGKVTLSGSGFTGASVVHVGTKQLWLVGGGFQIVNDNTITFSAPTFDTLGAQAVTVKDAVGSSNAQVLTVQPTNPPLLETPAQVGRGAQMAWLMGTQPGDQWFLTLSPDQQTFKFLGVDWLVNGVLVAAGTTNAAGTQSLFATVPITTPVGTKVFNQVIFIDPKAPSIRATTQVTSTSVF